MEEYDENPGSYGELAEGPARRAEVTRATSMRDEIAATMWESYQRITQGLGLE